jgi:hypothetical protein
MELAKDANPASDLDAAAPEKHENQNNKQDSSETDSAISVVAATEGTDATEQQDEDDKKDEHNVLWARRLFHLGLNVFDHREVHFHRLICLYSKRLNISVTAR